MTAFHVGRVLEHSFEAPEENLALEEVLLDEVEQGRVPSTLRFWESPGLFVVMGVGQVTRDEVDLAACEADGVPVRRRCSGGGCVIQGPGSLNYSLALSIAENPCVQGLRESYAAILGALCAAFERHGVAARHEGTSDLAVAGLKVSGNAQKRRRRAILHHGTLLYALNAAPMQRYLLEPAARPVYRGERTHEAFVATLPVDAAALRSIVREAFGAHALYDASPASNELEAARRLAQEKYLDPEWIFRR